MDSVMVSVLAFVPVDVTVVSPVPLVRLRPFPMEDENVHEPLAEMESVDVEPWFTEDGDAEMEPVGVGQVTVSVAVFTTSPQAPPRRRSVRVSEPVLRPE